MLVLGVGGDVLLSPLVKVDATAEIMFPRRARGGRVRLVMLRVGIIIEPLRDFWVAVQSASSTLRPTDIRGRDGGTLRAKGEKGAQVSGIRQKT